MLGDVAGAAQLRAGIKLAVGHGGIFIKGGRGRINLFYLFRFNTSYKNTSPPANSTTTLNTVFMPKQTVLAEDAHQTIQNEEVHKVNKESADQRHNQEGFVRGAKGAGNGLHIGDCGRGGAEAETAVTGS